MITLSQKSRAWIAIVAFIGGLALPWLGTSHVWLEDDTACAPAYLSGDDTSYLNDGSGATPVRHCPFCHWQRAVGGVTIAAVQTPMPWLAFVEFAPALSAPHVRSFVIQHGPSRAPPSALAS